jgi:hypothetical protein
VFSASFFVFAAVAVSAVSALGRGFVAFFDVFAFVEEAVYSLLNAA